MNRCVLQLRRARFAPRYLWFLLQARADPDRQRYRSGFDRGGSRTPATARHRRALRVDAGLGVVRNFIASRPRCGTAALGRHAVELGVPQGWDRYIGACGDMLGVERFDASAPAAVVLREYGFTVDNVCARAALHGELCE
jgi:hypothetical protein